jgi:Bacterial protein of unknown function (DUF903)
VKTFASLCLIGLLALCGCARHYVITLNNGSQIGTHSKPRLKEGAYYYKDVEGQKTSVAAGSVREIAPAFMANDKNGTSSSFNFAPSK